MSGNSFMESRFFRSTYLTLALACAALGYSELAFLPETAVVTLIVGALLIVAYRLEGRWSLPKRASNVIGAAIGIGSISWIAWLILRPTAGTILDQLPYPASLLPYLGPILMLLVPAKLFRPKNVQDFWALHCFGLIIVALGCALAGDLTFGFLLLAYLASLIWSLTLFFFSRGGRRPGVSMSSIEPTAPLRHSGRWLAAVMASAFALFLLTPRTGESSWDIVVESSRMMVGIDERAAIDLNKSGTVKTSRDLVFQVIATNVNGAPKTDLDMQQRWRCASFNAYEKGRWVNRIDPFRDTAVKTAFTASTNDVATPPPDPRRFLLEFRPQRNAPSSLTAEPTSPIRPTPGGDRSFPITSRGPSGDLRPWSQGIDGEVAPPVSLVISGFRPPHYQTVVPPKEVGVRPAMRFDESFRTHLCDCSEAPLVRTYTNTLIQRLIEDARLPRECWDPVGDETPKNNVPLEMQERVAHGIQAHLSSSGRFHYSLELARTDSRLDPVEDFLTNTRTGHCNRFASALTLMLRSQGIPARIVLGFQGCETEGDGTYEIRQCHAHSWVEALLQRKENGENVWRWVTFDATPAVSDVEQVSRSNSGWWNLSQFDPQALFRRLVVEYNSDRQSRAASSLVDIKTLGTNLVRSIWTSPLAYIGGFAIMALFATACILLLRKARSMRSRVENPENEASSLYRQLLTTIQTKLAMTPQSSQTPQEFAQLVTNRMDSLSLAPAFANLPIQTIEQHYGLRFGGQSLDPADRQQWEQRIAALDAALDAQRRPGDAN